MQRTFDGNCNVCFCMEMSCLYIVKKHVALQQLPFCWYCTLPYHVPPCPPSPALQEWATFPKTRCQR